ncbi:MAG: HAMP domain-containing sensor histidine kinase, partial [Thermostichales cyanobacterium GMQP_bins_62]
NRLNRLKDEFVATLSHELRTPLATVQMALKMIPQARDEQQRQRYYQTALAACEKETRLINDLLDFQTLELGNYQPTWQTIDLQKWIEPLLQVFQSRAQQANLTFQTNMDASLHPLRVDAYLLKRILEELLTNACTYTQRGGQITLTLTSQPGHALIQVENTATIPPEDLPNLFTKFQRLTSEDPWQYGGTGLGLALVKKMSDVLRARIEVNSQDNCTRFQLLLPRE